MSQVTNSTESQSLGTGLDSIIQNLEELRSPQEENELSEAAKSFNSPERTYVDTPSALRAFLPRLLELRPSTQDCPELACDSEGNNLGRNGSLTLLQIYIRSQSHTYVFDVQTLGEKALFDTEYGGQSLRKLMESKRHHQIWWDCRQDQDALYAHFKLKLGWVTDLQLMEVASRDAAKNRDQLSGQWYAIKTPGRTWMTQNEHKSWLNSFWKGKTYFRQHGYEVFDQRPLPQRALEYTAGDVFEAMSLFDHLNPTLSAFSKEVVKEETQKRLDSAMSSEMPVGSNKAPARFSELLTRGLL